MKNILTLMIVALVGFASCDPLGSKEPTTLPEMIFPISVSLDTAYIKLGDTIRIRTSIPSQLNDSVKVTDGKANIDCSLFYHPDVPVTTFTFTYADEEIHFLCFVEEGDVRINPETKSFRAIYPIPIEDSISAIFNIIPLKTGTYSFTLQSSFFEGSQGKARTHAFFDIEDNHGEELLAIPDMPALTPDSPNYKKLYYFAVYE